MNEKRLVSLLILTLLLFNFLHPVYAQSSNNDAAVQEAVLDYINQYRQQKRLMKLKMDPRIVREAQQHSQDMATHKVPFGHKEFMTRVQRLRKSINQSAAAAENVAYNYKNAEDVVKNWLKSPGHKRNIDGNYDLTGVGIAKDQKGKIYFTQIFINTNANSMKNITLKKINLRLPFLSN